MVVNLADVVAQAGFCVFGFFLGYYVIGELICGRIVRGFVDWWMGE